MALKNVRRLTFQLVAPRFLCLATGLAAPLRRRDVAFTALGRSLYDVKAMPLRRNRIAFTP